MKLDWRDDFWNSHPFRKPPLQRELGRDRQRAPVRACAALEVLIGVARGNEAQAVRSHGSQLSWQVFIAMEEAATFLCSLNFVFSQPLEPDGTHLLISSDCAQTNSRRDGAAMAVSKYELQDARPTQRANLRVAGRLG